MGKTRSLGAPWDSSKPSKHAFIGEQRRSLGNMRVHVRVRDVKRVHVRVRRVHVRMHDAKGGNQ